MSIAIATGLLLAGTVAATLSLARAWQQRHLIALFERTLLARWTDIHIASEPLAPRLLKDGVPLPAWGAVYAADRRAWASAVLLRPATDPGPPSPPLRLSYLLVELGGLACEPGIVPLAIKYTTTSQTIDIDYFRKIDAPVTTGTRVMLPVIEWPGVSRFDGLAVPAARASCVRRIRSADPATLPLPILYVVLQPDWRTTALYQRLRSGAPAARSVLVVR